jgi:uncharacterized protein
MAGAQTRLILIAAALVLGTAAAEAQFGANTWYTIPVAASRNITGDVETLVEQHQADIDEIDSNGGRTALDYAVSFDNVELAHFLLDHRAHVDARDKLGNTALHWAAQLGKLDMMRLLIEAKATIDIQSREGLTPIMEAADQGQVAAVRLLLQNGADPRKQDYSGRDAFGWATGKPNVLRVLNQHG